MPRSISGEAEALLLHPFARRQHRNIFLRCRLKVTPEVRREEVTDGLAELLGVLLTHLLARPGHLDDRYGKPSLSSLFGRHR